MYHKDYFILLIVLTIIIFKDIKKLYNFNMFLSYIKQVIFIIWKKIFYINIT